MDTSLKKVKKSGVYRNQAGHAIYLAEGSDVPAHVLDAYSLDDAGTQARTDAYNREVEPYATGIVDASQDDFLAERQRQVPQNKARTDAATGKTDAELADDAANKK